MYIRYRLPLFQKSIRGGHNSYDNNSFTGKGDELWCQIIAVIHTYNAK